MLYHFECNVRLVETSRDQCYTISNAMLSQWRHRVTGGMYSCKQNLSVQNENEILSRKVNLKLGRIF